MTSIKLDLATLKFLKEKLINEEGLFDTNFSGGVIWLNFMNVLDDLISKLEIEEMRK